MIRSAKISTKFSNYSKLTSLSNFIDMYRDAVSQFVNILWEMPIIPALLPKSITSLIKTDLMSWAVQASGKQASGIVRGTKTKQNKRLYIIDKLNSEGKYKKARKLQHIYDITSITKPSIQNVNPELDSRFIKISLDNTTSFDGWITFQGLLRKTKVIIPFKRTSHFNKLFQTGTLKPGLRLSNKHLTIMFDLPDVEQKQTGDTLGIDVGHTTLLSCSNGISSNKNNHGYDLTKINQIMSGKQKGSKGFKKSQQHRLNYINWSINQLDLTGINQINIENIKNMRKGQKTSKALSHWTYTEIFSKLESYCQTQGVLVKKINPTYTSKRCSACGWTRNNNRSGKYFKCKSCGFTHDADLNAAINISVDLKPIWYKKRQKLNIKEGFYWLTSGQEHIVPDVQIV